MASCIGSTTQPLAASLSVSEACALTLRLPERTPWLSTTSASTVRTCDVFTTGHLSLGADDYREKYALYMGRNFLLQAAKQENADRAILIAAVQLGTLAALWARGVF